ncbi:hypothetical protein FB562_1009 [Homoserinimonas aerilata]|uniref:AB hydrolase-1 domain-containing protein n=1 Tax=Homoserinimonas aerilata TaxID=1162970 RepID=A0A542YIY4_9MICO|nr:hypothetical protein FB562_1009 [Homoserinimonas aerilata]
MGTAVATFAIARYVITPPRRRAQDIRIVHIDEKAGTVTLSESPESLLAGRYGLWFDAERGHARVGDVVSRGRDSVTRRLEGIDKGTPAVGMKCRLSGWYYRSPEPLGVEYSEVFIDTTLGPAPAWLVPAPGGGTGGRWVIQVHGRAVDRRETIRAIPVFHDAGFTSLLISYRNDGVAPPSEDGRYALGDIEWLDVESAMRYAIDHGARDIVLMGWSMGGATVLQAATRSRLSFAVRGIVLDSPVVDWVTALRHQAGTLRIPPLVVRAVLRILSRPWGSVVTGQHAPIDLRRLDFVARAVELELPMLLLHSSGDAFVPDTASRALAAARPDIVTFPAIAGAGHTRIWNYDTDAWNGAISEWLQRLLPPSSL